tara:strand:- start:17598 stop:18011 length:414 start_codon:yes stop_codon:yes gene_type:complete
MADLSCWNCGQSIDDVPLPISRHATCSACFNELHCCRLCRHYRADSATGQCDEDRADPPVVKESANFCDWFRPNANAHQSETRSRRQSARSELDALFGEPEDSQSDTGGETGEAAPASKADDARAALDALFDPKNKV